MKKPSHTAFMAVVVTALCSILLLASCRNDSFVVTFDANGGSPVDPITLDGSAIDLPLPTKDHSRFMGWYFDDETFRNKVGTDALSDGSITANTTLYAKWDAALFNFVYFVDGAEYHRAFVEYGATKEAAAFPEKEGCRFVGWYRDADLQIPFDFTAPVIADEAAYGAFVKNIVVTFDANGGSAVDTVILDGSEIALPFTSKTDFVFDGWFFDDESFQNRVPDHALSDGSIDRNTTLYAKWIAAGHTLTYFADGAKYATEQIKIGETPTEAEYPVKTGYQFDGWFADEALTAPFDFTAPVTEDVAVYGAFLKETDVSLLRFSSAKDYVGYDSFLVDGAAAGATLPEDLVLPSVYRGFPVVILMNNAFKGVTNVKSVYIPDSVTIIGTSVFSGCAALAKVRMPRYLTEVGVNPFSNTALYQEAPDGYFYVGAALCDYKGAIPQGLEVVVREGTRVIADRVFWTSKNVVKVTLPASLVHHGFNAFLENPITEYVLSGESPIYTVQDGVLFTKDMTHLIYYPSGNARLSYTVPSSVVSIGDESFVMLRFLTKVTIPDSVETLGNGVFDMSVSLVEVEFGAGIRSVGDGVFHAQKKLARIIIKSAAPFPYGVFFLSGNGTPNYEIYIADGYIETYRAAADWKKFASRMKPLSEYPY